MEAGQTRHLARFLAAQSLAREAGLAALQLQGEAGHLKVREKGRHDLVTAADTLAQEIIAFGVREAFPDDGFLGEEGENDLHALECDFTWVVDPIDGTANFAAGRPDWCVSIGILRRGKPVLGVIYRPVGDMLYTAATGKGARLNGQPITVSSRASLEGATVAVDYSVSSPIAEHTAILQRVVSAGADFRRSGSAACQLANVAEGKLDGFIEMSLNAWDVCAGMVLVSEAGGWVCDFFAGGVEGAKPMIASNMLLAAETRQAAGHSGQPDEMVIARVIDGFQR
ncbi:inositol monophosphatase family protein [Aestuariivirga sp.]|uniref:inositol monophosphatase family protein n=1 Tax=Aestuariivirga sp. TaxID=2650926 RepID=UPI003019729B